MPPTGNISIVRLLLLQIQYHHNIKVTCNSIFLFVIKRIFNLDFNAPLYTKIKTNFCVWCWMKYHLQKSYTADTLEIKSVNSGTLTVIFCAAKAVSFRTLWLFFMVEPISVGHCEPCIDRGCVFFLWPEAEVVSAAHIDPDDLVLERIGGTLQWHWRRAAGGVFIAKHERYNKGWRWKWGTKYMQIQSQIWLDLQYT